MAKLIPRAGLAVVAALCLAAGAARANGAVEYAEAYSTEVAVLNSAPAFAFAEAVSREAITYNSGPALVYTDAMSREAPLYNSEPAVVYTQAYAREASLYNSEPALAYREAFSKEAVTYVSEIAIVDSFSREAIVYNGYYLPEAMEAIRIAGGFQTATPAKMQRFQMALQMTAQNRISLPVAAAILRIAIRLQ